MDLLLRRVRPMGGAEVDVLVRAGRIEALAPGLEAPPGVAVEEGGGALLLPGLTEAHTHLDKTLIGLPWHPHGAGPSVVDKIEHERALRQRLQLDSAVQSARQVAQVLALGTTRIRTHVDVDDVVGLKGIEGVMATRARFAGIVPIQIVAFPQSGLLVRPGVAELLAEAMAMGADLVGGLDPCAIDRDPKGHLDVVFGLAERFGRGVDIHLHEGGSMGAFSMELILERTRALGMQGQVAVSHAFCLGEADAAMVEPLLDGIAALDVAIVSTGSPSRPVPPLARLAARGIRLAGGCDGVRDAWNPYGRGDMLERAMIIGLKNNLRRDEEIQRALEACAGIGARLCGATDHGLAPGCRADLVLVAAETVAEAVASLPPRRLVVSGGRVVARDGVCLV